MSRATDGFSANTNDLDNVRPLLSYVLIIQDRRLDFIGHGGTEEDR